MNRRIKHDFLCNKCGRKLEGTSSFVKEGVCRIQIQWDYFSHKDGENHEFLLCEKCYDAIIRDFTIPVYVKERTELV